MREFIIEIIEFVSLEKTKNQTCLLLVAGRTDDGGKGETHLAPQRVKISESCGSGQFANETFLRPFVNQIVVYT